MSAPIRLASSSSSSSSATLLASYTSIFTNIRSICHLGFALSVTPAANNNINPSLLCSRRGKRMAHVVAKNTLGLTYPAETDSHKISLAAKDINLLEWKGDILAVGVTEKDMIKDENSKFQNAVLKNLDSQLNGLLSEVSAEEDFTGKTGQSTILRLSGLGTKRVSLVGLGNSSPGSSTSAYRSLGESVASLAKASQANNVAVALASSQDSTPELKLTTASAIATGTLLGSYEDNRFKSESKKLALKSIDFLGLGAGPELEKKLKYTQEICSGVILGKELVNAPANVLTPVMVARWAD